MKKYIPSEIEPKWQQKWADEGFDKIDLSDSSNKHYTLVEFTYPSGDLHIGHWFTFAVPDIYSRAKRMQGYKVFLPNGFDAFGLPAENAAIKRNIHPETWTLENISRMKDQFKLMGASYNWDHEVITCLPEYYKWNQWLFLKMYEKGLAYKGKVLSNWCPNDQTVLANEQVIAGKCERCGAEVIQKEIEQWFLKITEYAEKLIWDETPKVDWPASVREGQNNWIGKSEGVELSFEDIKVYTTRIDTIFGATFLVLSPEHPLVEKLTTTDKAQEVRNYLQKAQKKSQLERKENKEKTGVFTGSYVENPLTKEKIPVWIADYVLTGYGTGAIMAVPAHDERDFEFAKKFNLEIKQVIAKSESDLGELPYTEEGILINSGEFSRLSSSEAREKISKYIKDHGLGEPKVQYHLHDWSISRQRYWGTPIPIINCPNCGVVAVPEKDLPVKLPHITDFQPKGKPPLATAEDWVNVSCPNCGGEAKREVETMDTFFDSSWYFLRYLDPKNDQEIFSNKVVEEWMPLEIYFGGAEHTLGHTLYSRFFVKFLHDLGLLSFEEYAKKRVNHGVILGPDGNRMSKSRGNVVNPDEEVKKFGADAIRAYLAFIGPYEEIVAPWNPEGVNGVYHFLQRVWGLFEKVDDSEPSIEDLKKLMKTILKVSKDIDNIKFNTSLASLMEWLNHLSRKEKVSKREYKTLLLLLAPFSPHITEELWALLGEEFSIHSQAWPEIDQKYLEEDVVNVVVQINGKVRDTLNIPSEAIKDQQAVEKLALESERIIKSLGGLTPKKIIYVPGKVLSLVV